MLTTITLDVATNPNGFCETLRGSHSNLGAQLKYSTGFGEFREDVYDFRGVTAIVRGGRPIMVSNITLMASDEPQARAAALLLSTIGELNPALLKKDGKVRELPPNYLN